jgi:hypothetical protein
LLAALVVAAALAVALPATAARPYVQVVSVTRVVAKNDQARLVAKVTPVEREVRPRDLSPLRPLGGERPRP